ncbi:NADPH:quinone oxidoreductase family protein [Caulobacter mirabilis]|uniref:Quinone oxidoreductase n=1 Tax=Caulobacter mirabilis TaxID=69666 RepID=A0A2D2ATP9_9CAUL|nr:NADPH:quinone oxidoreductase family protein [Caulobacter mirabilis]ATQ41353.1 quinone oxidoreductase [Caulobacter mirabilis]
MKRVQADSLDSIADYRLIEVDPPSPGPGQVLVTVEACGVGYVDALVSLGRYQVKPPLPHTPGQEVGGVVAAVGEGVTNVAVGDRVMAHAAGGFQEQALAGALGVVKIPDAMTAAQAAGFRINYITALHGLKDRAVLQPGERVLVLGAAGGVGIAAVQVAKAMGAQVIAAGSSEEKRAFALAQGADAAIDTAVEGWRDRLKALCDGKGPDVVFDPVCGPLFEAAFRSLNWRGRHLVVGFVGGPIPALPANLTLMKGAALTGVDVRQFMLFEPARAAAHLTELLAWVAEGRLIPPVGRTFALSDYAEALEFALTGKGLGKTIIVP